MFKKNLLNILLILLLVILNSCSSKQAIEKQSGVFNSTHGFSIELPSGNNWDIKTTDSMLISRKKLPQNGFHTFYTAAVEIVMDKAFKNPNDFVAFVKKTKESGFSQKDYETISSEYVLQPQIAPFCIFYHQKFKDYATKYKGENKYLTVENFGYALLHPESPKLGVDIWYSERYASGEDDPVLRIEGDKYLKTLKIKTK